VHWLTGGALARDAPWDASDWGASWDAFDWNASWGASYGSACGDAPRCWGTVAWSCGRTWK